MTTRDTGRFSELSQHTTDSATAELLPVDYCLKNQVVVLGALPDDRAAPLTIGLVEPGNAGLLEELREKLNRDVEPVQLNAFEVKRRLSRIHGVRVDQPGLVDIELGAHREIDFEEDQVASKMVDDLLSMAIRVGATDVHLETYKDDVDLRFRIDTDLRQITTPLSPDNIGRVVARLKILCELDPLERRRPQDGRFTGLYKEGEEIRDVDFRVSIIPGTYGEDVVVRVLDPRRFLLDIDALGITPHLLERYKRVIGYPNGLILVTGPTLAGKTNTLYASVKTLQSHGLKIMTVEDPVELEFAKVNQKSVSADMSFADTIRAFLRQGPDIILVGEIRDVETAEVVTRAATTGHLVLTTVHTRDAIGAIARLRTLGITNDSLSSILVAVVGQRLLRRICEGCKQEVPAPEGLVPLFYGGTPDHRFYDGAGCDACGGSGYNGLVHVGELLEIDQALESAIGSGQPVEAIRTLAVERGFRGMAHDALQMVAEGQTTLAEVARNIMPIYRGSTD